MLKLNNQLNKELLGAHVTFETQENLPEKVIQFGEGNFLRAFVNWMIHEMNKQGLFNGKVAVVQPIEQGLIPMINEQDGLYTVVMRGIENGQTVEKNEVVSCISRGINPYTDWNELLKLAASKDIKFVISNTTEAGIAYLEEEYVEGKTPTSFPAKLTALLYHRFTHFNASPESGLAMIPCELIEENGKKLKEIVLKLAAEWEFPSEFSEWVENHNHFCSTLVDRIVTGYPRDAVEEFRQLLGYEDNLITVGEPFHLWAIDAPQEIAEQIPFDKAGLNVKWGDITPFRNVKVRLLNGPHTMMSSVCYLAGADTVQQVMEDETLSKFIKEGMLNEIYPTVDIADVEKKNFVESVTERFLNPYNKHYLKDIALSNVYKFKSRLIPSLLDYTAQKSALPQTITFALAGLLAFNRPVRTEGNDLVGKRGDTEYAIRDNQEAIRALNEAWSKFDGSSEAVTALVKEVLGNTEVWGQDLNEVQDLTATVSAYLSDILELGMKASVEKLVSEVSAV
ncbi:altronate oxidoreductase [Anaerobacillus alkalilacustris]|uniref:Altronate oxidoreductase n=1 Tax=Anaerobacillus alkalilacustris TaxID=393763 RepID=A0A1S2LQM7_9BACI|nr:tagaturonate reductase [Anaerobacillus alkalilacustris]OIJ14686.1 altronate oxidoreductase [Anaerobacillus alkalilacustris]